MGSAADGDTRQGLNATLSYKDGLGRTQSFLFRCSVVTWQMREIMDESQASKMRTMYPRKTAPGQFMVTAECKDYSEFCALRDWLRTYAVYATDTTLADSGTGRMMTVSCPARKFNRKGLLKNGITYGTHIGALVYAPVMVFETLKDPLAVADVLKTSSVQYGDSATRHANPDLESRYFYPFGTQLAGDAQGNDYTPVKDPVVTATPDADPVGAATATTTTTTNTTGTDPSPVSGTTSPTTSISTAAPTVTTSSTAATPKGG